MVMTRTQTLVQLNDELLARLDERAAREGRSRSALVREAIAEYLHDDRAAETDRAIVAGYTRTPPTEEERGWAEANAARGFPSASW
jgi:metal-responsive CopG/Arc/MetJ family transcriptional regulator